MKAVIIAAGTIADYKYAKNMISSEDYIICADGGLKHCNEMGIEPNLIVGDFDSLGSVPTGSNVIEFPCEKDYSDAAMGIMEAEKRGIKDVMILGGTGTRLDHVAANIGILGFMKRRGMRGVIVDNHNILFLADNNHVIRGKAGDTVSLIPIYPVKNIVLKGFKYPLSHADIEMFNPIWLSNELVQSEAEIFFDEGEILVDLAKD